MINSPDLPEKYEEMASQFDDLVKNFNKGNVQAIMQQYENCIDKVEILMMAESDPQLKAYLASISESAKWQLRKILQAASFTAREQTKCNNMPNDARRAAIVSTLQKTNGNGMKGIAGLSAVKAELRKAILLPLQFPMLFTGGRKPSNHILLYGPPGNGKTKLAVALAEEANLEFYNVSSADLLSSWVGESEKMIKELFEFTKTRAEKCLVFIDEIDSICRKRSDKEADHSRRMKNQLLVELDYNINNDSKSLVLCATNCPWDIDSAFLRRFQERIYVPLPDRESRLEILKLKSSGVGLDMNESDWASVVTRTEGYSGSDLTSVVSYAIQEPIAELDKCQSWVLSEESKWIPCPPDTFGCFQASLTSIPLDKVSIRNVKVNDFAKAILKIQKTVSSEEIEKYKNFV